jgi:hypothetical protein
VDVTRTTAVLASLVLFLTLGALVSDHILVTRLPVGQAIVMVDCRQAPSAPCFEEIQAAIDHVEVADPSSEVRTVEVYPGTYTEDVTCDPSAGHTTLVGNGGSSVPSQLNAEVPSLVGDSTGVAYTLSLSDCSVYDLKVQTGPNDGITPGTSDGALAVIDDLWDRVNVVRVNIREDPTDFLGKQQMIRIEGGNGASAIATFSHVFASAGNTGLGAGSSALSAMLYIDAEGSVRVTQSFLELAAFGPSTDSATVEIIKTSTGVGARFESMQLACETGANEVNCFEIDDANAVVDIKEVVLTGGLSTNDHGRFVEIVGGGSGSTIFVSSVRGLFGLQDLDSVWGSVTPTFRGECNYPHSVAFDPDETGTAYVSIEGPTPAQNATETNVNDWIMPPKTALYPYNFRVEIPTAPGAGNSWEVDLRDDLADVVGCTISGASATDCEDVTGAGYLAIGPESNVALEVVATGPPTAIDEMVVSWCWADFPR